jgi:hypothetical protein
MGGGGMMVKATRDAYVTEFRSYGDALTAETIELVQNPNGSLEPEAAAWIRERLEPNFEATAEGILNALQHDAAEGRVAHEQVHRVRLGLTHDLGILLDKAILRRHAAEAPSDRTSVQIEESESSIRSQLFWWATAPLLGLTIPEFFQDEFAWLRSSTAFPLVRLICLFWILMAIAHSLPLPKFRRQFLKHRALSTLAVLLLSIAVVLILSLRGQSSPQQSSAAPSPAQPSTAPQTTPQTAPPPQNTPPAPAANPKPTPSEPRQPATREPATNPQKVMSGAAKCEAIGRFIETGRKLDAACRASRCGNEPEIEKWTTEVRGFLKEHLTVREVIQFDNPPQQNWAVSGFPAIGPKLKILHDLYGRWNMLRDFLSAVDCTTG